MSADQQTDEFFELILMREQRNAPELKQVVEQLIHCLYLFELGPIHLIDAILKLLQRFLSQLKILQLLRENAVEVRLDKQTSHFYFLQALL